MMVKFFKIVWILSVFVILVFTFIFDGFRVFDFVVKNYTFKTMIVSGYDYNTSSRSKSLTIKGHIGKESVYFSRFDNEIEKLSFLYPGIRLSDNKIEKLSSLYPNIDYRNSKEIEVLKFKNSDIVMLIKDNEFQRWKTRLYLFSSYCLISIIILIFIKKK